jgi:hypothetical protein
MANSSSRRAVLLNECVCKKGHQMNMCTVEQKVFCCFFVFLLQGSV